MNKDFWERIDRLEELAGKATQGEWLIATSDGIDWGDLYITTEDRDKADMQWIATVDSALLRADEIPTDFQKEQNANACYIIAANPAMILEMIAEMRKLEREADWLAGELRSWEYDQALPGDNVPGIKEFRELARKTVSEADNA